MVAPTDKNVRDLASKVNAEMSFKSTFKDQPTKISCIRVPRNIFSSEILQQIDERM
jgi:hypothetical protein